MAYDWFLKNNKDRYSYSAGFCINYYSVSCLSGLYGDVPVHPEVIPFATLTLELVITFFGQVAILLFSCLEL